MTSDHNVQSWDLLGQLHVPLVPAGDLHRHLDHNLEQVSPVSEADDDVDPLSFKPSHLFGHWLQLVIDDEGARVGHLDGDDQDGDHEKGGYLQGLWGEVANHSHLPTSNLDQENYDLLLSRCHPLTSQDHQIWPHRKQFWSVLLIKFKEISQQHL